jgi:hypothetical protein
LFSSRKDLNGFIRSKQGQRTETAEAPLMRRTMADAPHWRLHSCPQLMFEPKPGVQDLIDEECRQEARMNHWHDSMVDRPETDGGLYVAGWTISGLAVLGTIIAVWVLGI